MDFQTSQRSQADLLPGAMQVIQLSRNLEILYIDKRLLSDEFWYNDFHP